MRRTALALISVAALLVLTGCGDLEPEYTRRVSVTLTPDYRESSLAKTSESPPSRTAQVSQNTVDAQKTHLLALLPAQHSLTSKDYKAYARDPKVFAVLSGGSSYQVTWFIPTNTAHRVFAFLFTPSYTERELFSGSVSKDNVSYYGESSKFFIDSNTSSVSVSITLRR